MRARRPSRLCLWPGCVREAKAISLIPVPSHVTRHFSEHVLGFPVPSPSVRSPLPFPLDRPPTGFAATLPVDPLMPVFLPISLNGMDASLSSAHLSFPGSRSKPHRVGGFGHTPIRRVVFVISASCLLRPYPHPSTAGPTSPALAFPRRSFRNYLTLTTTARDKTRLPNYFTRVTNNNTTVVLSLPQANMIITPLTPGTEQ